MQEKNNFGSRLTRFILNHRIATLIVSLAVVFTLAYSVKELGFSTNYRLFFSDKNPQLLAFDKLQETYTQTDNVMFVIKPNSGDITQTQVLSLIQQLTEDAWLIPYTSRVDSISNFQHTVAEGDDLIVSDLIEDDPKSYDDAGKKYIANIATNEPLLEGRLINKDATTTGVNVTLQFTGEDPMEVLSVANHARDLVKKYETIYPDVKIVISGVAMMNTAFMEASMNDMSTLIPLMYLILVIALIIFLRSVTATLVTLALGVLSIIAGMGFGGWMGYPLTPPSSMTPTIILTLAIADAVHILSTMFKNMTLGMTRKEAIIESMRINLQPVFLTSVTTAIGFLSLNFSDAPPFHHLGNMSAMGVMIAFFLSVTFLPIVMSILPVKAHKTTNVFQGMMDKLANWVIAKRKPLLIGMSALIVALGLSIPRIDLNDEFLKYFSHDISFRGDTEFMLDNLTGVYLAEYSVGASEPGAINNPEYLTQLEKFANWLEQQPEVRHVYSFTDIIKRLNKNMHSDNEDYYRIPDSRELAAQYLLLYEMSLPYGLDLNDRINVEKSATRVSVTLHDMTTVEMRAFKYRSEQWMRDNLPDYMHTTATSPNLMFSFISERNINSMIPGNILALFVISGIILLALKSIRLGLLSLAPNLVPVIMAFGIWALTIGQVNMAVAIVMAVSLGIIVDDTVHFLSKYHRARKEKNLPPEEAVRYAFHTVGAALTITTLTLVAGFAIMMFSSFQINSVFGLLTALSIVCALIADFLLLPPILMALDKKQKSVK